MPRFLIHHVTKYTYPEPVRDSANQMMLYPVKDEYQDVQSQRITISNEPFVEVYKDYYGNEIGSFMNIAPHIELRIDSNISIVTKERAFPLDDKPAEAQWHYLSEIQYIVPYI
jgi:transglutaminase-like putative cysteine protease